MSLLMAAENLPFAPPPPIGPAGLASGSA